MMRTKKGWALAYCTMTLLFWFSNSSYEAYLLPYANSMQASALLIGVMLGAYGWGQLLLRIPIGILADRYHKRLFFVRAGCISALLSALLFLLAPTPIWLVAGRAMNGVAASAWVVMTVLYVSYFEKDQLVKQMTLLNSCNTGGRVLSALLAMPVAHVFGIRGLFMLGLIAAVPAILISFFLKDKPVEGPPLNFRTLLQTGNNRWVLTMSAMGALCQLMTYAGTSGFTPELALQLGARETTLSLIQLLFMGGGVLFSLVAAKSLVKKVGARNLTVLLLFIQALTTILQPLMPNLFALYTVVLLNGIARGGCISLMLGLVVLPFPYEKQSSAMGFYQAIYSSGMIVGPMLAGAITSRLHTPAAFYAIGGIGMLAPLLGLLFLQDERRGVLEYN